MPRVVRRKPGGIGFRFIHAPSMKPTLSELKKAAEEAFPEHGEVYYSPPYLRSTPGHLWLPTEPEDPASEGWTLSDEEIPRWTPPGLKPSVQSKQLRLWDE